MPLWVWICLAVSLAVVVPTLVVLTVASIRLWQRISSIEQRTGVPVESLLTELETMNDRLERANERSQELEERLDELNGAMEKVAVIRWALGDTRSALGFWRSLSGR